jgi:hypothetical protein
MMYFNQRRNKQKYVNYLIEKKTDGVKKKVLEINDICTMTMDKSIKSVFRHLPVMIRTVIPRGSTYRYKICTKHGHLQGAFLRKELDHRKNYTATTLQIDTSVEGIKEELTVQEKCNEIKNCTGCSCMGDCATTSRCSGRSAGYYCTTTHL